MRRWLLVALAVMAAQACWAQHEAPRWAVDPTQPGPDAPPAGRSLFDFVATTASGGKRVYDIPFPFERLIERMEARAGCAARERCAKQVLIPLGRSLQRLAAAPDFFRYPRVVATIDAESAVGGALLKDRIYLGYQEQSGLIEVISYNEAAGRFEFQIVHDYRPGGSPRVVYARRAVCAACHQNLAPMFSLPLWEETNANERVAARLERERKAFYGVPVRRGIDFPEAIDAATGRANWLGVWQRLWSEGCGAAGPAGDGCRAAAFTLALQYRLTGGRVHDEESRAWREDLQAALARAWRERWSTGLAIPNPDIPNRDPLPFAGGREPAGALLAHVGAGVEALAPRPPLEIWESARPDTARRLVAGLAGFLSAAEVRALDHHLRRRAARAEARIYEAPCEVAWSARWLRFKCASAREDGGQRLRVAGRLELTGGRSAAGELNALATGDGAPLEQLELKTTALDLNAGRIALAPDGGGMRARLAGGAAVERIELNWRASEARVEQGIHGVAARATVRTVDDFALVRAAIAAMAEEGAFGARPFSRAALFPVLFSRLGLGARDWCCDDGSRLPPASVEDAAPRAPTTGSASAYAAFYPLCASCHATSELNPAELPFRIRRAGGGERQALCAPDLRPARDVAHRAGREGQDADAAAAAEGGRDRLQRPGVGCRAGARRGRTAARRERQRAAHRGAPCRRLRGLASVPRGGEMSLRWRAGRRRTRETSWHTKK